MKVWRAMEGRSSVVQVLGVEIFPWVVSTWTGWFTSKHQAFWGRRK